MSERRACRLLGMDGPVIATRGMPLTGISRCAITWWSWRGTGPGMAIDGCGSCFVGRAGIAITSGSIGCTVKRA